MEVENKFKYISLKYLLSFYNSQKLFDCLQIALLHLIQKHVSLK